MKKRISKSVKDACLKLSKDDKALTKLANDYWKLLNVKYKVIAMKGKEEITIGETNTNANVFDYKDFIILRLNEKIDQGKFDKIRESIRKFRYRGKSIDGRFIFILPPECEVCKFEPIVEDK